MLKQSGVLDSKIRVIRVPGIPDTGPGIPGKKTGIAEPVFGTGYIKNLEPGLMEPGIFLYTLNHILMELPMLLPIDKLKQQTWNKNKMFKNLDSNKKFQR